MLKQWATNKYYYGKVDVICFMNHGNAHAAYPSVCDFDHSTIDTSYTCTASKRNNKINANDCSV